MFSNNKKLFFRLELNGRLLYEIYSDDIKSDISIGRSGDNTWIIPSDDCSASNHHAKITFKNKAFYVEDLNSRNGLYYQGQRIQEKKMKPGDLFSIGDCKLIVEYVVINNPNNGEDTYHKFEQLSGKNKGRIYHLVEQNVKIGSSTGCSIVIDDSLVSHVHAVLENHTDGTCWIKDMKSRNGTKVNGLLLTEENIETGRMLKDGDVISIAYIDFRFWDKNVTHIRSHLILKIGVIVATLAITIGGYFAFQTISPSAKKIRLVAESYASKGEFEHAQSILQSAITARGAETDAEQRKELVRKLKIWANTLETWNKIKKLLNGNPGDGELYEANDLFSNLVFGDRESWQWNVSTASTEMKKAYETQQLLSILLGAEDWFTKSEEDIEYLKRFINQLEQAVSICQKNPQPYQEILLTRAKDIIDEMRLVQKEYGDLQHTIDDYKLGSQTMDIIKRMEHIREVAEIRNTQRKKEGKVFSHGIIGRCQDLLTPLYRLQNSQKILEENYVHIANFNFKKFKEDIFLPSSEECIVASTLSLRRAEMESSNLRLKNLLVQFKNYQAYFRDNDLFPEVKSTLCKDIFDEDIWMKVLTCDCLNIPQPLYSDKRWRSIYDKTLGVYVFWEYLRSLGGEFDTTIFDERFKPDIFKSKEIFDYLEVFVSFCNPSAYLPFYNDIERLKSINEGNNVLSAHYNVALNILKQRDDLVKQMYEIYQHRPNQREGVIAGGVAICLDSKKSTILPSDFSANLNKSLKLLRENLAKLVQQNSDATPEQVLYNEKKLLQLGIPGDSFLKQPWTDHLKKR